MKKTLGNYLLRSASLADLEAVTELIIACDIAEFGVPDFTLEDLQDIWSELPLECNSWVVYEESGNIVGYGFIEERNIGRLDSYGYVHPDHLRHGIGTYLVECFEKRARDYINDYQQRNIEYEFNNIIPALNQAATFILEQKGFSFKRIHSRMGIELTNHMVNPNVIKGIQILPYNETRDTEKVFEVYSESFFSKRASEAFDKSFWKVAYMDEELVGFIICEVIPEGIFIDLLGVKRQARKKGIAAALLQTIFKQGFMEGFNNAYLTVDANSLTNANRVYEKVGMRPLFQLAIYGK